MCVRVCVCVCVCGRLLAGILGSNPADGVDTCLLWVCVFSGRGLCGKLITRPGESYSLPCVVVCDLETSRMRRPWPTLDRSATGGGDTYIYIYIYIHVHMHVCTTMCICTCIPCHIL